MYNLVKKTAKRRTYRSAITGTEVHTTLIKTDPAGNKWWAFEDLMNVPFMRKQASERIHQLYSAGVTKHDLAQFTSNLKKILKANDPERYEKAYAEVLRVENIMNQATDPVKQSLSLASVFILSDDERIDTFDFNEAAKKMEAWSLQPDLQAFFLNWQTDGMNAYTTLYSKASQIASLEAPEK